MTPAPVPARLNYGPMRMLLYEVAPGLTVASAILDGKLNDANDFLHELVHRAYGVVVHQPEARCRTTATRPLHAS